MYGEQFIISTDNTWSKEGLSVLYLVFSSGNMYTILSRIKWIYCIHKERGGSVDWYRRYDRKGNRLKMSVIIYIMFFTLYHLSDSFQPLR